MILLSFLFLVNQTLLLLTRVVGLKEVHLLLQEAVEQQMLQPPVEPRQDAQEEASSQAGAEGAAAQGNSRAVNGDGPAPETGACPPDSCQRSPAQTDESQLPDAGIETGVKLFPSQHIDHLPLVVRNQGFHWRTGSQMRDHRSYRDDATEGGDGYSQTTAKMRKVKAAVM